MKSTTKIIGYPHDYGNLHVLLWVSQQLVKGVFQVDSRPSFKRTYQTAGDPLSGEFRHWGRGIQPINVEELVGFYIEENNWIQMLGSGFLNLHEFTWSLLGGTSNLVWLFFELRMPWKTGRKKLGSGSVSLPSPYWTIQVIEKSSASSYHGGESAAATSLRFMWMRKRRTPGVNLNMISNSPNGKCTAGNRLRESCFFWFLQQIQVKANGSSWIPIPVGEIHFNRWRA